MSINIKSQTLLKTHDLLGGILHLTFSGCSASQVTETMESKPVDGGASMLSQN